MKTKQLSSSVSYKRKVMLGVQAGVALILACLLAVRALDTGSLQQYGLVVLFLIIAIVKGLACIRRPRSQTA